MHEIDEKDLINRATKGDIQAFEQLIAPHQKKVYNIALHFFKNHNDAEEMAQEALLKAFCSIVNFQGNSSFSTWIYRIATNTCIDKYRKDSKNNLVYIDEFKVGDNDEKYTMQIKSNEIEPEDRFLQKELRGFLLDTLDKIPIELKTIILLREIQGFNYDEISKMLDLPLGTVKSRLSRSRELLKKIISQTEHFKGRLRLYKEKEGLK